MQKFTALRCNGKNKKCFCANLKQIIECRLRLTFNAAFGIVCQLNAALRQLLLLHCLCGLS